MTAEDTWSGFSRRLSLCVDFGLLTVLEVDWEAKLVRRSYSSDETNYPSGGVKRLMGSQWADHVILGGQTFRSQTRAEFRSAFHDHETLEALGLFYALNVPCMAEGRTVRTINLLRGGSAFPPSAVSAVRQAQAPGR
jgi:hypothetical protein